MGTSLRKDKRERIYWTAVSEMCSKMHRCVMVLGNKIKIFQGCLVLSEFYFISLPLCHLDLSKPYAVL